MATTARPLRLPPSVQIPPHTHPRPQSRPNAGSHSRPNARSHARPRSSGAELHTLLATSPAMPLADARHSARGADLRSAEWLDATFPRRENGLHLPTPVVTALAVNLVLGALVLTWLLPSPWGGAVPALMLAQLVAWRHGAAVAVWGLALGTGVGSLLGPLLGLGDWRRSALALLFVLLPAMLAWPARRRSVAR